MKSSSGPTEHALCPELDIDLHEDGLSEPEDSPGTHTSYTTYLYIEQLYSHNVYVHNYTLFL